MAVAFFEWKNEYSVGNSVIDEQHKVIIKILDDLYKAFMIKEHDQKLGEMLNKLTEYTNYHFRTEENYFKKLQFEFENEHIKEHKDFIDKVEKFKKEYETNKSALTFKVISFLREWLNHHILISDKKYSKLL